MITRFAPSTTGDAHPGTLLSGLLVWLAARAAEGHAILRLEDLDHTRVKDAYRAQLLRALDALGLVWDATVIQSDRGDAHAAALDRLAATGRLYPCRCSRSDRAASGRRAPDGGWAYDNRCRDRPLPPGGWRAADEPLRARLDDDRIELVDELGVDLSQTPAYDMGDPIVRRRDGVIAYQLAVVVDDADAGITDVIRGRDIAPSTATQILLQRALGYTTPRYFHHFLLLEPAGEKLAKLHGSIPFAQLAARYDGGALCGLLAAAAGLGDGRPCAPEELVGGFAWTRVRRDDAIATWDGDRLAIAG